MIAGAYTGSVVCMAAQLANCVWLGVAWPHLATLTWHLALSFLVFVRLVQPEARPSGIGRSAIAAKGIRNIGDSGEMNLILNQAQS